MNEIKLRNFFGGYSFFAYCGFPATATILKEMSSLAVCPKLSVKDRLLGLASRHERLTSSISAFAGG
jgi:hypothetical protein